MALFFDSNYVDTATNGDGEAYNLQQTLLDQGYVVNTFTGVTTLDWTTALSGAQVVAVPELEVSGGDLPADLEAGALAALQAFVNSGGRLITFSDRNFEFLEEVLDLPVDSVDDGDGCPCTKTAAAAGTDWASGPATLDGNDATDDVLVSTLPAGTASIYSSDSEADALDLALIPLGDWFGRVPRLGLVLRGGPGRQLVRRAQRVDLRVADAAGRAARHAADHSGDAGARRRCTALHRLTAPPQPRTQ